MTFETEKCVRMSMSRTFFFFHGERKKESDSVTTQYYLSRLCQRELYILPTIQRTFIL